MYDEAAGKLRDPATPNGVKAAALRTLKEVVDRNGQYFKSELATLSGRQVPGLNGPWSGAAGGAPAAGENPYGITLVK
jgi:hypothetical protein